MLCAVSWRQRTPPLRYPYSISFRQPKTEHGSLVRIPRTISQPLEFLIRRSLSKPGGALALTQATRCSAGGNPFFQSPDRRPLKLSCIVVASMKQCCISMDLTRPRLSQKAHPGPNPLCSPGIMRSRGALPGMF